MVIDGGTMLSVFSSISSARSSTPSLREKRKELLMEMQSILSRFGVESLPELEKKLSKLRDRREALKTLVAVANIRAMLRKIDELSYSRV